MNVNKTVYVGDLPSHATEAEIFRAFITAGPISSIKITRKAANDGAYAYINFNNTSDAEKAVAQLNFTTVLGSQVRVALYDTNKDALMRYNVIVRNLPPFVDSRGLFDTFSVFGDILSCKVALDTEGNSKQFGYVCYKDKLAMRKAIALANGTMMDGCVLKVAKHERRDVRVLKQCDTYTNVYCKSFAAIGATRLENLLKIFGQVTSFYLQKGPDDSPTGVAFCNFADPDSARRAVGALHGLSCAEIIAKFLSNELDTSNENAQEGIRDKSENKENQEKLNIEKTEKNSNKENQENNEQTPNAWNNESKDEESRDGSNIKSIENLNDDLTTSLGKCTLSEIFYIQRAQTKAERHEQLKEAYRTATLEGKAFKRNLYVVNLPPSCQDDDIVGFFQQFGTIINYKLNFDPVTKLKFAYICFSTSAEAEAALQANDAVFDGHKISIQFFKTKKERAEEKSYKSNNPVKTDERKIGSDLYGMVLSMADLFRKDWPRMGVDSEYAFADRITKLLMNRPFNEVRNMIGLSDILSNNIMEIMKDLDRAR